MAEEVDLRHYVKSQGHAEILTELDENGTLGAESWTKIVQAALRAGDTKIAKCMITSHVQDDFLNDLLHTASEVNNTEIVELLLQKGAEINADVNGKTALYIAVEYENLQAVKLLLKRGADPKLALPKAIQLKSRKIVEALLKRGASVNYYEGDTPLYRAVCSRDWDIIRLILNEKPVDTDIGRALGYDWITEIDKLLKIIKKSGLKTTIFPGDTKNCMYKAIRDDDVDGLKQLMKHRDFKTVSVGNRVTALHVATFYKHKTVAEVLLSCGADVFAKDVWGDTSVDYVIKSKDFSMLELFLKMGTTFTEHSEMLLKATIYGLPDFIKCMIQHGADLFVRDSHGYTALHIATCNNDVKSVHRLLTSGADPNATCAAGTALHCVTWNVGNAVAQLLFDYGADINLTDAAGKTPFEKSLLNNPQLIGPVLGQIVKLKTANMYISDANLDCWDNGAFDWIGDEIFVINCEKEIEMMKTDDFGMYDVLVSRDNRLARLCKNENPSSEKFDKYPIYSGMIKGRLNVGKIRREFFERCRVFFDNVVPSLPSVCVDKILGYLTNEELRSLENVCAEIKNCF